MGIGAAKPAWSKRPEIATIIKANEYSFFVRKPQTGGSESRRLGLTKEECSLAGRPPPHDSAADQWSPRRRGQWRPFRAAQYRGRAEGQLPDVRHERHHQSGVARRP